MSNNVPVKYQLEQLKALTIRTGVIHEAQILQLKYWTHLIPGAKGVDFSIDPDIHLVKFNCSKKGKVFKKTKKVEEICNAINEWVRTILWNDSSFIVDVDDKRVYESKGE